MASSPFEPLWYPYTPPLSGAPTGTLRFSAVRAGVESAAPVQRRHPPPSPPPLPGPPPGTLRFSAVRAGAEPADPVQRRHRRSCIEAGHHGGGHHGGGHHGDGRRAATDRRYPVGLGAPQPGAASASRPRMPPCNPCKHPGPMNLLAFDTSTDTLSIAVQHGADVWQHTGPGGARASVLLIPQVLRLMAQAGLSFDRLDALVFGRGPGSFTGLRTACAVAQGLAYGARGGLGLPGPPADTLLAVAEDARQRYGCTRVVAVLDARMDEVYHARCEWLPGDDRWRAEPDFGLGAPESVQPPAGWTVAGNARARYGPRLGGPPPPAMCGRCPRPGPCCAWRRA